MSHVTTKPTSKPNITSNEVKAFARKVATELMKQLEHCMNSESIDRNNQIECEIRDLQFEQQELALREVLNLGKHIAEIM